jgi:hypothetical protein
VSAEFWERHWWLILALAALAVPIFGVIGRAWTTSLYYQHRREALEALKAYAAQGKTPPPEVVEALSGRRPSGADFAGEWADEFAESLGADRGDRYARRAEREAWRAARWRTREPYRRWNSAVFFIALTAGFAAASQYAGGGTADAFLVTAIILGAVAVGAVITALISTFIRPGP